MPPRPHRHLWLFVLALLALPQLVLGQGSRKSTFTFDLTTSATTSAGVFTADETLVRTLWSGVKYKAGSHVATWDNLDDEGRLVTEGDYHIKVLSNNVSYDWEGVVGNTSEESTGASVYHAGQLLNCMTVVGNYAYVANGYNEGGASWLKFDLARPNRKINIHDGDDQTVRFVASDGVRVYWSGQGGGGTPNYIAASVVATDADYTFSAGSVQNSQHHSYNAIGVQQDEIDGLGVQTSGNFLFASSNLTNVVRTFNKVTGAQVQSLAVTSPRELVVTPSGEVWLTHDANLVEKYTVSATGVLTATGQIISAVSKPIGLAMSPNGATLAIIDYDNNQVKGFSTSTRALTWTLGSGASYATNPTVENDKFYFRNTKMFTEADLGQAHPFICFQPDGSLWVGDTGNYRCQHFSASRVYQDQVAYIGYFYSAAADRNNPTRVFANYLEYQVDYSKPLQPNNGSWRLLRNWSAGRLAAYDDDYNRLLGVTTLANGHTYALATHRVGTQISKEVIELAANGIRYTGISKPNSCQLNADGSLWNIGDNRLGQPAEWTRQPLTGFDSAHNPLWGTFGRQATTPPITPLDPVTQDGWLKPNHVTSSNVVVAFCNDRAGVRGTGWHLGGIKAGTSEWLWKTSPSTTTKYRGDFPADGTYDNGNGVHNAGSFMEAIERNIFWGYQGEFWKNGQTNMWNHYLDNGLFVGQFGAVRRQDIASGEAVWGMAGNAVRGTFVKVGRDYYLYHCDEFSHGGLHRWKISGLDTIEEQNIPLDLLPAEHGLLEQAFSSADLNNFYLTSTGTVPKVLAQNASSSMRWTGYVEPLYSQPYTFYTKVSQKARLWVNNQLVIDQWTNTSNQEFRSKAVDFEAGKKYAIKLEISGGNADLSWASSSQAKQVVLAPNLYAAIPTDTDQGLNLAEGLSFSTTLENGLYGWTRTPTADYGAISANTAWEVFTNITTQKRATPDINIFLRPATAALTATVSRNLGAATTDLPQWSVTGSITYPVDDYDNGQDASYLQVLDDKGKVIARFSRQQVTWPGDYRLLFNGQMLVQRSQPDMRAITMFAKSFTLSGKDGKVTFQYGSFPAISTIPVDPTSNVSRPKTLQVLFFSKAQNGHEVNISNLHFVTQVATTPVPPTLTVAKVPSTTLAASHSLGTSELLVETDNNGFVPYTGQIAVGNAGRPAGYWKFKVKAAAGRNESAVVSSPEFIPTNPLPVKLISLEAHKAAGQVLVRWSTASEENVEAFEVERSADGQQFAPIGRVPATNTSGSHQYSLPDKAPLPGTSYYRLRIKDLDATFSYSKLVTVTSDAPVIAIYPVPVQQTLNVQHPAAPAGYLEVLSANGQKMSRLNLEPGSTSTAVDVQRLPPGFYVLRFYTEAATTTKTFVKE